MTLIEKICAEIERLEKEANDRHEDDCYLHALYDVQGFIESLEKEPRDTTKAEKFIAYLNSLEKKRDTNLESAIKEYFQGLWPGTETAEQCNTDMHFTPPAIMRLAKHFYELGAKWDAEQGETVEGEIVCAVAHPHENKVIARVNSDYKFGEKVILQIRKK